MDPFTALKFAIQMTKMLIVMEQYDVFFADFHGENIMLKKDGDLVLTDFGASARITDRSGKIAPKGFCAGQISEKFEERKQSAAGFKERLFNEHHSKQLLMHFKVLQKAIPDDQRDEFSEAFGDLITY